MAIAYGHRQIFLTSFNAIKNLKDSPEQKVLEKLLILFGANLVVTKYLGLLYEGNFIPIGFKLGEILQNEILNLLPVLKNEVVSLVDAISPPDFILNSPLGMSDGKIYQHLEGVMYQTPDTFTRPTWWGEILQGKL